MCSSLVPRLVAVALLYLEQEDAFWCLVAIVEGFMPRDYYTKTLLGSQVLSLAPRCLVGVELERGLNQALGAPCGLQTHLAWQNVPQAGGLRGRPLW